MSYVSGYGVTLHQSATSSSSFAATASGVVVDGTARADTLRDIVGGATLRGGSGDDTYVLLDPRTETVEAPGAGIDTVVVTRNHVLGAELENLTASQWNLDLHGNAAANLFLIHGGGHRIDAAGGGDVIVASGSAGRNAFVYHAGSGADAVYGFKSGSASHDFLELNDLGFSAYSQVASRLTQQGADVRLQLTEADSVTLRGVQLSDLGPEHFLLELDRTGLVATFSEEFNAEPLLYSHANGGSQGWKSNYFFGSQTGVWDWTSRTMGTELQVYTEPGYAGSGSASLGLDPFSVNDGVLTITAEKVSPTVAASLGGHNWSSGLLTTEKSFAQTYGYFEIRAKLPEGAGMWPAFWLYPEEKDGHTELDIFEQTGGTAILHTVHAQDGSQQQVVTEVSTATTEFHTYGVLWTADTITYYVDGQATGRMATPADMHRPMYMLVNLAVSGGGWAGTPDAQATSAAFQVDYVRAYALPGTSSSLSSFTATALNGSEVKDELIGLGRYTVVEGRGGNDLLDGGEGGQRLVGGTGDDIYVVDDVRDVIVEQAGQGLDTVRSFVTITAADNVEDVQLIGLLNVSATGNGLTNTLTGNDGQNTLSGGAGDDSLRGAADRDVLMGGLGDDTYTIASWYEDAWDTIIEHAGEGNDTVRSAIDHALAANVENVVLTGADATAAYGNGLANVLTGNQAANRLEGRAGDDVLNGADGDDVLDGGDNADLMNGGSGADTLRGGNGNDTLFGNQDNDHLFGGSGDDVLTGGSGDDRLEGEAGVDTASYANAQGSVSVSLALQGGAQFTGSVGVDVLISIENLEGSRFDDVIGGDAGNNVLSGLAGADRISGGDGSDTISGGDGDDIINGNVGDDLINGNFGADVIYGGQGDDNIMGGHGDDQIMGSLGNDRLVGGLGADRLEGGLGADVFVYTTVEHSSPASRDLISNVEAGVDKIDLRGLGLGSTDLVSFSGAGALVLLDVDRGGDGTIDLQIAFAGGSAPSFGDLLV